MSTQTRTGVIRVEVEWCYHHTDPGTFDPKIGKSDARRPFKKQYFEMVKLFESQDKIVPVAFADAMALLFSDNAWERRFMIAMWEMLKVYAKHHLKTPDTMDDPSLPGKKVFDYRSDYPQRYTARGGRVPLISGSRLVPLTGLLPAKYYVGKHAEYSWKFNEMRFSILAARVLDIQPQCHQSTSIKRGDHLPLLPPPLNGRKEVTFGQLLPSIFLGQGKSANDGAQWDVNQFGCFGCDAFAGLLALLAVAGLRKLKGGLQGGLQKKTIEVGHLMDHAKSFVSRRFLYEDFWRFFGRAENQRKGGWDTGNNHAMWKMDRLDLQADRKDFYSAVKVGKIKRDTEQFLDDWTEIVDGSTAKTYEIVDGHIKSLETTFLNAGAPVKVAPHT